MRIAFLTQSYPPMISGASIVVEQLAQEMVQRGHEVLVIAASDREYAYTQINGKLSVMRLRSINNPLRVGQRFILASRQKVLQALGEFQPDVLHIHDPIQLGAFGLEYASKHQIPTALTTHQLPWFVASYLPDKVFIRKIVEKALWLYARWLLHKFTSVITPTKTVARIIKSKTGVRSRAVYYGIDLDIFHDRRTIDEEISIRSKYGLPLNSQIILHTGRLDADKLVQRVALAAAEAMQNNNAHLLIVGDGQQKENLMNLCKSLGIGSRTHFTGFIADKAELARIYRTANLFVTASEIETQGIVILEAAACGLPIVAVKATCIPEVVHHEVNGLLVDCGDIQAMSQAINSVLNDGIAPFMRIKSRSIAEKYSKDVSFTRHEKHYQFLIRQNKKKIFIAKQADQRISVH